MKRTDATALATGLTWNWQGETLTLLPQRAVWWPTRQTLLIADPHIGKAATFRSSAIPIPDTTAADLRRLDEALLATGAATLLVLGDMLHARRGRCDRTFALVDQWRARWSHLRVQLIVGNHDRHAGPPPATWQIESLGEPFPLPPFQLCHHPPDNRAGHPAAAPPTIAGHLHPKFRLQSASDRCDAPGFLLRSETLILPAFGSFVDHLTIKPEPGDRAFLIADDQIHELTGPHRSRG